MRLDINLFFWLMICAGISVSVQFSNRKSHKRKSIRTLQNNLYNNLKEDAKISELSTPYFKSKERRRRKKIHSNRTKSSLPSIACSENKSLREKERSADLVFTGRIEWFGSQNDAMGRKSRRQRRLKGVLGGVSVKTILKGSKEFEGKLIKISGFKSQKICHPKIRVNDNQIFFASLNYNKEISLSSSPLRMTLKNLQETEASLKGNVYCFLALIFMLILPPIPQTK